jgi:tetratricopeptide (TPR) repeat protein
MCKFWDDLPADDVVVFHKIAGLYLYDAFTSVVEELDRNWERLAQHKRLLPELYQMKSYCLWQLEREAEALAAAAKGLEIDPDHKRLRECRSETEKGIVTRLQTLMDRGEWDLLEKLAAAYLAIAPKSAEAQFNLGVSLDQKGDNAKAMQLFGDLVERFPLETNYRRSLTIALRRAGQTEKALETCRQAITDLAARGVDTDRLLELERSILSENGGPPRLTVVP